MELNDEVLFGDIWERPGLSKRDRSLITVATLVALYRINELPFHLVRARENGISKDELAELLTHLAFYAGWPTAMTAVRTAMEILAETDRRSRWCQSQLKLASFPTILEGRVTDERAVPPGELINHGVREMPRPIVIRSLETVTRGTGEVNIGGGHLAL